MRRSPSTSFVHRDDTHRLIPSRHSDTGDSVLIRIADGGNQLADIFELDDATNDRLLAESELLPGIGIHELVFRIPYASIMNAAFTHAHPLGSRFNGPERGAWYAGYEIETSKAEVIFHHTVQLAEVGRFEDSVTYDDYLADFRGEFHDLRIPGGFKGCLDPGSYVKSQGLAEVLFNGGSLGIVYTSVRLTTGTCIVCFRPALVTNVRKARTYNFVWSGQPDPEVS